ncbi:DoxX family membrane protein [Cellulosimicrobium cellulans]|uniref:DoxX family membrane protein n=1 Tax=Cellulosimicrobium cellulans TaxID=1710 RepID=UPI00084934F5|nr:DoxX family membrane protein [Cellulosimicrobium cellulans]
MLLRHVARPMLASWFVYDGVQTALKPAEHVRAARDGVDLVERSTGVDASLSESQVATLVRAHGAATAVAGLCLAFGKAPRTAALALAALAVPLAVVNQPFTSRGPEREERTRKFVANLGAIGAALIAGADYEGRPGVQWRLARARHDLAVATQAKQHAVAAGAKGAAHGVTGTAKGAAQGVKGAAKGLTGAARGVASSASSTLHDAGAAIRAKVA